MSHPRTLALCAATMLFALGCRQDMHDAPRYDPLEESHFHADSRSARLPVEGTVARGNLREDVGYFTGKTVDGQWVAEMPVKVDLALLRRGQERYNIFCAPCHDQLGNGRGLIVRRGFKQPATYHSDRLRTVPVGYFVDVITNGFGQMPTYAPQVKPADRWAIAAYIRALQYSQNAPAAELSQADRQALAAASAPKTGADASTGSAQPQHGGH